MRCKIPNRDLSSRLHKTIIRFEGEPVFVTVEGSVLHLFELGGRKVLHTVNPDDVRLDVSTPPLGYYNLYKDGITVYAERMPLRMYKQGLSTGAVKLTDVYGRTYPSTLILCAGYKEACMGQFPPLNQALKKLRLGQNSSIAVSNDIALSIDKGGIVQVYYRKDNVGWMAKDTNIVNVPSNEMGWIVSIFLDGLGWEIN